MRTFFGSHRLSVVNSAFALIIAATAILAPQSQASAKPKYAGIVMDAKTGKVLYSRNADARRYPASLTKMMTLYLVFEDLKRGKIKLNTRVIMSRHASRQPPSKLGIKPGRGFTVKQGIYALVTKSANDVATALGENLSGSEKAFARRMTRKARQLGMSRTVFKNANGLPNRQQVTTARDMAKLGLALKEHFPREFSYFKTRSFKYGRRRYRNHNRLLGRVKGVDGIKTGYTRASGFNLVSSVKRGKRRIVAVVLGGKTGRSRNAQMSRMITKYLPRASRGRAKILIARAQPPKQHIVRKRIKKQIIKKAPVLVASVTTPTPKPNKFDGVASVITRVDAAHKTGTSSTYAVGTDDIRKKLIKLANSSVPLPTPSAPVDDIQTGSIKKPVQVAVNQASHSRLTGWQIQIGATPDRKSANKLLKKARARFGKMLRSRTTYLEPVVKGDTTLIRARFAGFSSKITARNACSYLKKRKFACLAIHNR